MWARCRGAMKWLVITLLTVGAIQVVVTFVYVTSGTSHLVFRPDDDVAQDQDSISLDWLRNASLRDLRALISDHLDPLGFFSFQTAAIAANKCIPPWSRPDGSFNLTMDTTQYFKKVGSLTCLSEGTDFLQPLVNLSRCPCLGGWSGVSCSIPDSVRFSNYPFNTEGEPRVRKIPRRVVQAMPFNIEFEMLEARFAEVGDIVDAFLLLESNYTAYGDPKPLRLLDRLRAGYYADVTCKIVHVFLDYFPRGAAQNGWIADNVHRDYIAGHGVAAQLKNYRMDDVFFMSDADELVTRESILFLKLHEGWPEPVGFHLQRNAYGFFWRPKPQPVHIIGGVTFGVLTRVLNNHAIWIRSAPAYLQKQSRELRTYLAAYPAAGKHKINKLWSLGNKSVAAGFHCSWCCPAECMRIKLVSAQNGDFPRWGDYPAKTNLTYIRGIIQRGLWFDNVSTFKKGDPGARHYAPRHMLDNWERYQHVLVNPYRNHSLILTAEDLKANTAQVKAKNQVKSGPKTLPKLTQVKSGNKTLPKLQAELTQVKSRPKTLPKLQAELTQVKSRPKTLPKPPVKPVISGRTTTSKVGA